MLRYKVFSGTGIKTNNTAKISFHGNLTKEIPVTYTILHDNNEVENNCIHTPSPRIQYCFIGRPTPKMSTKELLSTDDVTTSAVVVSDIMTNITEESLYYPREAANLALSFCVIYAVVGACANLLTIISVVRSKHLRNKVPNVFVVNLAAMDLLFCVLNLPINATRYATQSWILGDVVCKMFPFIFYANLQMSLLLMMLIAVNRFIAVGYSQQYDNIYKKPFVAVMIILCWIYCLSLLLPVLFGLWGEFGLIKEIFDCDFVEKDGKNPKNTLFILGSAVPFIVVVLSYVGVFVSMRRRRKRRVRVHILSCVRRIRDENRLNIMLFIVFFAFAVCLLPATVLQVLAEPKELPYVFIVAIILLWSMSVINPILYGFLNKNYRHAYANTIGDAMKVFCCRKRTTSEFKSTSTNESLSTKHRTRAKIVEA